MFDCKNPVCPNRRHHTAVCPNKPKPKAAKELPNLGDSSQLYLNEDSAYKCNAWQVPAGKACDTLTSGEFCAKHLETKTIFYSTVPDYSADTVKKMKPRDRQVRNHDSYQAYEGEEFARGSFSYPDPIAIMYSSDSPSYECECDYICRCQVIDWIEVGKFSPSALAGSFINSDYLDHEPNSINLALHVLAATNYNESDWDAYGVGATMEKSLQSMDLKFLIKSLESCSKRMLKKEKNGSVNF